MAMFLCPVAKYVTGGNFVSSEEKPTKPSVNIAGTRTEAIPASSEITCHVALPTHYLITISPVYFKQLSAV